MQFEMFWNISRNLAFKRPNSSKTGIFKKHIAETETLSVGACQRSWASKAAFENAFNLRFRNIESLMEP